MASGAGLNRVGTSGAVTLLVVNPSSTALASPLTGYGNAGNDSYVANGPMLVEAADFTKVTCTVVPVMGSTTWSGYTIEFYATTDSRAYAQWRTAFNPMAYFGQVAPTVPAASWFPIIALSDQSGTGTDSNPITAPGQVLSASRGLVAIRAVLTATTPGTGTAAAQASLVP